MNITVSTQINAPLNKVFEIFTDLGKAVDRIPGVTDIEIISGANKKAMITGTKWNETRIMFGKTSTEEMLVTDLTPNRSYTVESKSDGTNYITIFTFEHSDNVTTVTMNFTGTPLTLPAKIMGVLILPFFIKATKNALENDLKSFKEACEA